MTTLEIWLLAISLAMDCFTVSITSGIIMRRICWRTFFIMAFFFGLFQAVMPLIGWFAASRFSHLIEDYDHWIAFGLLAFLGGRMIKESFSNEDKPNCPAADFIMEDVRQKVDSVEGVTSSVVNLVFEPEWDKDMMSEEAKLELGFL